VVIILIDILWDNDAARLLVYIVSLEIVAYKKESAPSHPTRAS
jgi:hypothetical protein